MGRKSKTQAFVLRPWCWYCEREFEDEKVLLQHQKSKHFKCQQCPRKLNTAGGLMVHSQQVHKCEPEPLTNTLPGRDGFDIEIFGMEGVPVNALAEWKARKEAEAGTTALASAAAAKRPRFSYTVIPEADLMAALAQHKALMAARSNFPKTVQPLPAFPAFPGMPPPTLPPFAPNLQARPPAFVPQRGLPPPGVPLLPARVPPVPAVRPPAAFPPAIPAPAVAAVAAVAPKDGVMWPEANASPAEKRAQQVRYRYQSPTAEDGKKRKAAADFL